MKQEDFSNSLMWTHKTNDREKNNSLPKAPASSVKPGGASVVAWASLSGNGAGTVGFIVSLQIESEQDGIEEPSACSASAKSIPTLQS